MRPLVQRVVGQTRARVLGGDTHVPDKVLSVFEPHTETIRKGKIAKPNEFGNLVTIQEAEHQIITAYEVHAGRPADVTLWTPALDRHQTIFGRAPDLAAGDRGFSSARNEQAAVDRGVRRVILPRSGPKSPPRRAGASDAKAASVCSNVDMACAAVATVASVACIAGSASA
jgi:IS5 family transposase